MSKMTVFTYNNAKNASIDYTPFESNCSYYFRMFYKKDINLYVFYIPLLEQDTTRKGRVRTLLSWDLNLVTIRSTRLKQFGTMRSLQEKRSFTKPLLPQHLRKMINTFHKDYPNKLIVTSRIDTALLIARPIIKLTKPLKATKQQQC